MRRHRNAIADADVDDVITDALDDSQRLMSDHDPFAAAKPPLVDVQVGPTNRRRREPQEHVGWSKERRIRDYFNADLPGFCENDCFHQITKITLKCVWIMPTDWLLTVHAGLEFSSSGVYKRAVVSSFFCRTRCACRFFHVATMAPQPSAPRSQGGRGLRAQRSDGFQSRRELI